ncbi:MAG TPA: ABC transporter permease [Solirubrobacteraceae bacterium]|jgi:ABC-type transport system involved in multi-copper enzyme maturation permease subunit|nr:ABC transporter permease [Solirubrobacteraceae bacterium]
MSSLLRAELLKLRTTRTFVALVGAALSLSLLVVVLTSILSKSFHGDDVRNLFTADFTGLFIMLLGVIGMAGEWRHRTITGTVLAAPNRLRLLSAKMLSYAAAGALLSLIVSLTIMLVGTIIISSRGFDTASISDLADVLWRNLVVAALVGALGVGVGGLVRNQVVVIIGVLIVGFVVEPTLSGLAPGVERFGPTQGAPSGIQAVGPFGDSGTHHLLSPGIAVLVMLGWIALFFAAAGVRLRSRDLV